jgi:hypothetical protein
MRREVVDSEAIASNGYARSRKTVEIEFRGSGNVYRYFEVSAEESMRSLWQYGPRSGHLNQVFKAKGHRYIVVKRGKQSPHGISIG